MDADGARSPRDVLPPGIGYDWTAMSYQEKIVGNTVYFVFALALLLVYLVLAGQYESWIQPLSVMLGGAAGAARHGGRADRRSGAANNLYTQIGLMLLIALSAKNAHPDRRIRARTAHDGKEIVEAAVEAARLRFRPILMTSFAFILGVLPLVLATGAGARAALDRHHRVQRHAGLDLPRRAVRAVLLRGAAAPRGMAQAQARCRQAGPVG